MKSKNKKKTGRGGMSALRKSRARKSHKKIERHKKRCKRLLRSIDRRNTRWSGRANLKERRSFRHFCSNKLGRQAPEKEKPKRKNDEDDQSNSNKRPTGERGNVWVLYLKSLNGIMYTQAVYDNMMTKLNIDRENIQKKIEEQTKKIEELKKKKKDHKHSGL